ncbi:MAG TPA: hypothetical protein VFB94_10745 [Acidimicrobiales bacterium]|jgi:hypothetical protein|nr:hypothetical protein [Acidimicrobiales bacterium]
MRARYVLGAMVVVLATVQTGGSVAAQQPSDCPPAADYCVGAGSGGTNPGGGGSGGGGGGGGGGGSGNTGPVCHWTADVVLPGDGGIGAGLPMDPGVRPTPDAVLVWEVCDGVFTGEIRWAVPGVPLPVRMSARALAMQAQARLAGRLPTPEVTSSPPPGVAALVGFPSFVTVDNWVATVTDSECDPNYPNFCVSVVAQPSLSWAPGEPGAEPVVCAGPGTPFVPGGAPPEVQAAAPGACAHTYRARTGVLGRPALWPGQVTVVWTLTYASPTGSGTLPPVTKSADLPRAVDEVQTVVEDLG